MISQTISSPPSLFCLNHLTTTTFFALPRHPIGLKQCPFAIKICPIKPPIKFGLNWSFELDVKKENFPLCQHGFEVWIGKCDFDFKLCKIYSKEFGSKET